MSEPSDLKPELAFVTTEELLTALKARSDVLAIALVLKTGAYSSDFKGGRLAVRGLIDDMHDWMRVESIEWMQNNCHQREKPE